MTTRWSWRSASPIVERCAPISPAPPSARKVLNACRDVAGLSGAPDSKIITSIITCGDAVSPHTHVPSDAERHDRGDGAEMVQRFSGDLVEDEAVRS